LDLKGRKTSWRKLHNDELDSLYSSPNIVTVRGGERCLQGFGWEARSGRLLGRPRRRWEDNIKLDLREIGIDGTNWIQLAQDMVQWRAFVDTVMNLRIP
jgi:hypothetical protein